MMFAESLAGDFRFATKFFRSNVPLASIAVLLLMIGLGTASAVAGILRGLLLDPLPEVEHEGILALGRNTLSAPDFEDLRVAAKRDDVGEVAAYVGVRMGMRGSQGERLVRGALVSENYFDVLGVKPSSGRSFAADDKTKPVAIISNGLWHEHFGGKPVSPTTTISLGSEVFAVIGVAPPGFTGVDLEYATDVWVPIALHPKVQPAQAAFDLPNRRTVRWLGGLLRVEGGVTPAQAQSWVDSWMARMSDQFPSGRHGWAIQMMPLAEAAISEEPRQRMVEVIRMIVIVSGLILLITCANLAILLLVGFVGRTEEIGVRLAHGASLSRIARQLLIELSLITVTGCVAGLLVGSWLSLVGQRLVLPPQIATDRIAIDSWILGVTLLIAIFASVVTSLPLFWRLRRAELTQVLRRGAGGASVSSPSRPRALAALIIGQMTFTLLLLQGVLLVSSSLIEQLRIDPGFSSDELALATVNLSVNALEPEAKHTVQQELPRILEETPGVSAAALAALAPIGDNRLLWTLSLSGTAEEMTVSGNVVSSGYFKTLGITMLRGRDFESELDGSGQEPVVVINSSLADRLWPGQDAIGRQLQIVGFDGAEPHRVIGVVADSRQGELQTPPQPFLYRPLSQDPQSIVVVHASTVQPLSWFEELLRATVSRIDSRIPVAEVRTLAGDVEAATARPRYLAIGMSVLGTIAALLTAVGLYGVLSFVVRRQAREIGIRMSLGACPARVWREILSRGLRMVWIGLIPGLVLAVVFNRWLASHLYGLKTFDIASLGGAVLLLVFVAVVASLLPAFRARSVNPASMLREG